MMRATHFLLAALFVTPLFATGCSSTTALPVLTNDLAVVSASALVVPEQVDIIVGNAIWRHPDQAAAITEVAVAAAPQKMFDIRRAAILSAPEHIDEIVAAAARATKRPIPAAQRVLKPSELRDLIARTERTTTTD